MHLCITKGILSMLTLTVSNFLRTRSSLLSLSLSNSSWRVRTFLLVSSLQQTWERLRMSQLLCWDADTNMTISRTWWCMKGRRVLDRHTYNSDFLAGSRLPRFKSSPASFCATKHQTRPTVTHTIMLHRCGTHQAYVRTMFKFKDFNTMYTNKTIRVQMLVSTCRASQQGRNKE